MKLLYIHQVPFETQQANIIQVLQMCQAFHKIGMEVTLALPKSNNIKHHGDLRTAIEEKLGISPGFNIRTFHCFSVMGKFKGICANIWAKPLIRLEPRPDICFVRSIFLSRFLINHGCRTVYECHASVLNSRSKILDHIYRQRIIKDANHENFVLFVAISQALANLWRRWGIPADKLIALHDATSAEEYDRVVERLEARSMLNLPRYKKIAVYAGSLYRDRKIEDILKLAEIFKDVLFYVVGGPENRKREYVNLSVRKGLDNIHFTGHVPYTEVKKYLFAADILLMLWSRSVSTIEICSPLKIFEYMASERIIVGDGFPTIKEVLKDGETALLSDPDSFDDLKNKFQFAKSQRYPNAMAIQARKTVLGNYTWESRAKAIENALRTD